MPVDVIVVSRSRVKVSASLAEVGSLTVEPFHLVNRSLTVVGFVVGFADIVGLYDPLYGLRSALKLLFSSNLSKIT